MNIFLGVMLGAITAFLVDYVLTLEFWFEGEVWRVNESKTDKVAYIIAKNRKLVRLQLGKDVSIEPNTSLCFRASIWSMWLCKEMIWLK